ncbi:glucoamylase [Rhodoblastus acidophilus]|nr:glycoside hydrolase family 15 protein [Rhodoblastus acidophilus]MCW2275668.1 glucoamylase [Rhodoblastus acidophilus]
MSNTSPVRPMESLDDWLIRQYERCAEFLPRAISATHLTRHRRNYGQTIRAAKGAVLASTDPAENPDYFFHWLRDSAIVIDGLRILIEDGRDDLLKLFGEFVDFSLGLTRLDGRANPHDAEERAGVLPDFVQYVRTPEEMAFVRGEAVLGEARLSADGRLDILQWSRPQNDGPALRALALMRYWRNENLHDRLPLAAMRLLIEGDLDYTLKHWREPCYDIWEEHFRRHYHTQVAQYAALSDGADWARALGDEKRAEDYARAAAEAAKTLDGYFYDGAYRTPLPDPALKPTPTLRLDFAVILGVVQAARRNGPHSPADPRAFATLAKLEDLFDRAYLINRNRPADCGTAHGRYDGDVYFTGGAFYFSTLGAAEFYYRSATAAASGEPLAVSLANRTLLARLLNAEDRTLGVQTLRPEFRAPLARALIRRGDAVMATVRRFAPESGVLAEQFSHIDGAPTSALDLTWSYASFIIALACRKEALRAVGG